MLRTYGILMAGGALGTALRFWVSTLMTERFGEHFPLGTLVANVTGCFTIGLFSALTAPDGHWPVHTDFRQFVMIGILGGYTTFSSFGLQTMTLVNQGALGRAAMNVSLSFALCLASVWLGHWLGSAR